MNKSESSPDYRNSHTADGYGDSYHAAFDDFPHRKYLWEVERKLLDKIIGGHFSGKVKSLLDFACGTGRIIGHVEPYCEEATGVDISAAMIEVAKKGVTKANIVQADLTKDNVFEGKKFQMITSFRFFLNAQKELRYEVMEKLASLLDDDGFVVFNIHNNTSSITNRISKLYMLIKYRKKMPVKEMSISEVKEMLDTYGLEVHALYNYATYPIFNEKKNFSTRLVKTVDSFFSSVVKLPSLSRYIIYVAKKKT